MPQIPPIAIGQLPPAAVWRIGQTHGCDGLTVQDAMLLVGLYTNRNATIVDFDADPALALAARARTRCYSPGRTSDDVGQLGPMMGAAQLVHLVWPRSSGSTADAAALFEAVAALLADDGILVVCLTPRAGRPDNAEHVRLCQAMGGAGLGCFQRIVIAETASDGVDRFTYHADAGELDALLSQRAECGRPRADLLICSRRRPSAHEAAGTGGHGRTARRSGAAASDAAGGGAR